jgi:hypothetical protein
MHSTAHSTVHDCVVENSACRRAVIEGALSGFDMFSNVFSGQN